VHCIIHSTDCFALEVEWFALNRVCFQVQQWVPYGISASTALMYWFMQASNAEVDSIQSEVSPGWCKRQLQLGAEW